MVAKKNYSLALVWCLLTYVSDVGRSLYLKNWTLRAKTDEKDVPRVECFPCWITTGTCHDETNDQWDHYFLNPLNFSDNPISPTDIILFFGLFGFIIILIFLLCLGLLT